MIGFKKEGKKMGDYKVIGKRYDLFGKLVKITIKERLTLEEANNLCDDIGIYWCDKKGLCYYIDIE